MTRILLVEDDAGIRELYAMVLETAGYTVVSAPNTAGADVQLAAGVVDILLTDHYMPGLSGAEYIQQIRVKHPEMRTLLMSSDPRVSEFAQRVGADGWFLKSPQTAKLLAAIQALTKQL